MNLHIFKAEFVLWLMSPVRVRVRLKGQQTPQRAQTKGFQHRDADKELHKMWILRHTPHSKPYMFIRFKLFFELFGYCLLILIKHVLKRSNWGLLAVHLTSITIQQQHKIEANTFFRQIFKIALSTINPANHSKGLT